ncbi:MAG: hypothetical protein HOV79_22015 [Hamadaea sp.]|nr:hypothetical protein [Hamadaea sp.]
MTTSSNPIPPVIPAAAVGADLTDEERAEALRPSDAEADRARTGAEPETDVADVLRDAGVADDGTPVGEADRDADVRRSGGDPSTV